MATTTTKSLRDKAMLVKFTDSVWSRQCRDQRVRKDVADRYEAKKEKIGYYNKFLVSKDHLEARARLGLAARRFHNLNTLPWLDDGVRTLPATNFQEYMAGMRKFQKEAEKEDKIFFDNWPTIMKEGMALQGKLARVEDYPTLEQLRQKFAFDVVVLPIPETADWRIDIPQKELLVLRKQAEATLADIQVTAIKELWSLLYEEVEHCHERLKDEDNTFRNSLFENIKKRVALTAKLNIAGDAKLEALRKEVETKLSKQTPDEVRSDPGLRGKVAKDAADIMKKMKEFMK